MTKTKLIPYITKGEAILLNELARMGDIQGVGRMLQRIKRRVSRLSMDGLRADLIVYDEYAEWDREAYADKLERHNTHDFGENL